MTREISPVGDAEIRAADVLVLVDPRHPGWQRLLWSTEITDGMRDSATLEIVEITVDSRVDSQVEAERKRVSRIKGEGMPG